MAGVHVPVQLTWLTEIESLGVHDLFGLDTQRDQLLRCFGSESGISSNNLTRQEVYALDWSQLNLFSKLRVHDDSWFVSLYTVHCTPCLFWENTACQVGHPPVVFCTPGNRLLGSWHFNFNGLDMFCWFVDVIFSGSMSPNCFPQGSVREDRGTFELEYRQGTDGWKVTHWEGQGNKYLLHTQFTSVYFLFFTGICFGKAMIFDFCKFEM